MTEQVGGFTKIITLTPVISASPDYTSGDLVGTKLSFLLVVRGSGNHTGLIQSVIITDLEKQSIETDVVFFDADPSNTTFTDNAALDVNDTDLLTIAGVATVNDWAAFNDNSVGQALNLAIPFDLGVGTTLYGALVTRGAPNHGGTSDLTVRVSILQD